MTDLGALVGQVSGTAAIGSQAMVDIGLEKYFGGSRYEIYYGDVRVESAAYQDDILKPTSDILSAQAGMTRLAGFNKQTAEAHVISVWKLSCKEEGE